MLCRHVAFLFRGGIWHSVVVLLLFSVEVYSLANHLLLMKKQVNYG